MSVQVRFAPSPTGKLHVGNARAALINYLFARRHEGRFWLRLDDTDTERSTAENAASIEHDLGWLGLEWDRFARQSDRLAEYEEAAQVLRASGRLYPAYETEEELDAKRAAARIAGRPPIYDRAALRLTEADHARMNAEGKAPHWRFRMEEGEVTWPDLVHGVMRFDGALLGDPVVIRADGRPLYLLSSVVDDIAFGITHVLRGDDHISNTAIQVQMFAALGGALPVFGHVPLLMDIEGGKLSKRKGALALEEIRELGIEPMAVSSLLARLGTSDPIEPHVTLDGLAAGFELGRFSTAPARFDPEELERLSARILHATPFELAQPRLTALGLAEAPEAFWLAVRGNLARMADVVDWWRVVDGPLKGSVEEAAFLAEAAGLLPAEPWDETSWGAWTGAVQNATGRKGKALFKPLRLALTGREDGPEMKRLLPLIGRDRARSRLEGQEA